MWCGDRIPYWYRYGGYGYGKPWAAVSKEEEIAIIEVEERCLTSRLDVVKDRLEELRK